MNNETLLYFIGSDQSLEHRLKDTPLFLTHDSALEYVKLLHISPDMSEMGIHVATRGDVVTFDMYLCTKWDLTNLLYHPSSRAQTRKNRDKKEEEDEEEGSKKRGRTVLVDTTEDVPAPVTKKRKK